MAMPAESLPQRRSPERIGRYQVIERIGRGAMGLVYRARDEAMGREVALKVLMTDLEDDPDIRTRFQREAEAAARLSHPNIITIFDVGEDGERFFIVMELLRGATLKDFLKQESPPSVGRKLDLDDPAVRGTWRRPQRLDLSPRRQAGQYLRAGRRHSRRFSISAWRGWPAPA